MGYRSQIAFCITVDRVQAEDERGSHYWDYDRAKFKEMVGFFKLTKFYEVAISSDYDLLSPDRHGDGLGWKDGCIVFHANDWKWYDGYTIVEAYKQMWEQMQDIEGISGYFLRVGEGDGNDMDIDEEQFGNDPNYQMFGACAVMNFDGEEYLGESNTDEEGQTEQAQTSIETQPDCAGTHHATQTQ